MADEMNQNVAILSLVAALKDNTKESQTQGGFDNEEQTGWTENPKCGSHAVNYLLFNEEAV